MIQECKVTLPIFSAILFLVCAETARSTTYYVDASAGRDANPGTSASQPWQNLSKVNGLNLVAGDTVLLKKGESWTGGLSINNKSGSSAQRITIGAYGTGSNPSIQTVSLSSCKYLTVTDLTVEGSSGTGVSMLDSCDYLTFQRCLVQNHATYGISIWSPGWGEHIEILDNTIRNNGTSSTGWSSGLYCKWKGGVIAGNTLYNNGINGQAGYSHGIYLGPELGPATEVRDNVVYNHARGHGIQIKRNANVYRNFSYNNSIGGIYFGENGANDVTGTIYANVLVGNRMGVVQYSKGSGAMSLTIYNNTFYHNRMTDTWTAELKIENDLTSLVVKNNILYAVNGFSAYHMATQSNAVIDYNCVYGSGGSDVVTYGGSGRTWSSWQGTLGFDTRGMAADPMYTNPANDDFTLAENSPCINAGEDMGHTLDFEKNPVPVGAYDMGALEHDGSSAVPQPKPPTNLRIATL